MSFFQNPFLEEFRGNWVLGDRHQNLAFVAPPNLGRGSDSVNAWNQGPYDLSGNDADGDDKGNLTIVYTLDFVNWAEMIVNVEGATPSATTANEIITILKANTGFAGYFNVSSLQGANLNHMPGATKIFIKQKFEINRFKFYVKNGGAEEALRFNGRAPVVELPTYFSRHTVGKDGNGIPYARTYSDCSNTLVELDISGWATLGDSVAGDVVANAVDRNGNSLGFDPTSPQDDYELLAGRSGLFMFYKNTVDGSNRITESIEYQAGATVGDFAKKINYTYDGSNTVPDQKTEIPYVLTASDLVTP